MRLDVRLGASNFGSDAAIDSWASLPCAEESVCLFQYGKALSRLKRSAAPPYTTQLALQINRLANREGGATPVG